MIKAVCFDVDGVLIDSFEANLKFYQDLLVQFGYKPVTRKVYSTINHINMMDVIRILTKSKNEKEVKKIWQTGKDSNTLYPNELVSLSPNCQEIIKELNKKYTLAVVTSRIRGGVFSLPTVAPLKKFFKVAVYYEDTTKHKPDPAPLLLAATKLGIQPKNIVYIGDAPTDMQAAKAAGMKAISFGPHSLPKADAQVSSFKQILTVVSQL